ncbi:porin family protein [Longitalea luteola]|uniref:porin family protein n=1 Tax=Longitalea luteola TaxID=2812563 RepID=UPI001A967DA7|nr:porin family protein [Longitalea luteola]
MKSKVLLLALATTALALTSKAQDAAKTTFGVRAGVNFTNITGDDQDSKIKPGFNIGVNAEVPVATDFYLQPGLLFTTKGAKADEGDGKVNLSYLEVPINFLYKPTLGDGKLLLGFGPYVGFGIGGKYKEGDDEMDVKFKNDVKAGDQSMTDPKIFMKGLDFGGNLLVGYELSSKLSFQLNAQLGMSNLNPKFEGEKPEDKIKNTGFGISVGYRF